MSIFGGFSNFPRRLPNGQIEGPLLGPIPNTTQGFKETQRGAGPQPKTLPSVRPNTPVLAKIDPQIMWSGIIHGYSGYAKANREIVKRVLRSMKAGFAFDAPWDAKERDKGNIRLLKSLRMNRIDERAPQITFLPPRSESRAGYRIIYTMMETEVVHKDMIHLMNSQYHECWVPTEWNAGTFKRSGLTLPVKVMPLGIDPDIYHPDVAPMMPEALCLTGKNAGKYEVPSGFLFIYVCQPTFRKGIEVVIEAFCRAFENDQEAGLIIASTSHSGSMFQPDLSVKPRIWLLNSPCSETDLAGIYKSCKAYVCASRGEGWNLPMMEAAGVGIPLVIPRTSAHPDLVPEDQGFFFAPDHTRVFDRAKEISHWFEGISFPDFGERSHQELIHHLKMVKSGYRSASEIGMRYMKTVRTKFTWDRAAETVIGRIKELCQG